MRLWADKWRVLQVGPSRFKMQTSFFMIFWANIDDYHDLDLAIRVFRELNTHEQEKYQESKKPRFRRKVVYP